VTFPERLTRVFKCVFECRFSGDFFGVEFVQFTALGKPYKIKTPRRAGAGLRAGLDSTLNTA
jgi:hypothetical protein